MLGELHYNIIKKYITGEKRKMTLEGILSKIADCNEIQILEGAHISISKVTKELFYVQPNYEEIYRSKHQARFILFSAPGACGKSALAKYIAYKYRGLYWDLAKITLGENSFHGTLWRAMQQDKLYQYFNDLKSGKGILILDAFDEAEMISGRSGIEYFLKDLSEATESSVYPTVLLFARTESATFIAEFCGKNAIEYAQYEIGFFEEYNAKEFIRKKLETMNKPITQTVNSCIDEQFVVINKLLGNTEVAKSFLGYAPVLEALVQSFDEERNTVKLLEKLKGNDITTTRIIFDILQYLLEREHEKVCSGLKEKWGKEYPEFSNWNIVYCVEEQMVRIVEYIILGTVDECSFYSCGEMPTELYSDYIESLKIFLPQHPFLQNLVNNESVEFTGPAFRDYVLAFVLSKNEYEDLALEYFSDRSVTSHFPSQLLFDFYVVFSDAEMTGKIFPLLYDSYKAKETATKIAYIDISSVGSEKFAVFRLDDFSISKKVEDSELCIVGNDALYISRLANGNVDIEGDVYIGDSKNTSRIYNSTILAQQIYFNTVHIYIEARKPGNCLLVSEKDVINKYVDIPKFEIQSDSKSLIKISIPNINNYYKLRPYKYNFDTLDGDNYLRFCMFVKKIMNCLRKHRKDAPAKDKEFIDNEIISKNQFKRNIMEFLINKEIIYIDSKQSYLYKLNVDRLTEYCLSWVDFTQDDNRGLLKLYSEFSEKK